jgi:sialidase-1
MNKILGLIIVLMIAVTFGCSRKLAKTDAVKITATHSMNPVLKRLPANPLLRININVADSNAQIKYRSIHCTLNANAIKDIQTIEVYDTDTKPEFTAANKIATIKPSAQNFDIPVNVNVKGGTRYIWLSATLNNEADIDDRIDLHAITVTDVSGKIKQVAETGTNTTYTNPLGIALRNANDDGVHTYRIPGITTTDKGTLIGVYDIRYKNSADLPGNIDIGMNRSTDGGKTWEPMKIIMHMDEPKENNGVGDPSVLFDPVTKTIWVAALWSKGNHSIAGSKPGLSPDETGQFVLVSSNDDGRTWSQAYNITTQVKNPAWRILFQGPGNGMAMKNGTLVFPAQYWDADKMPHSTIIYSADHGLTWKCGIGAKPNTTESEVVETVPGTLMLNMRDNRGKFRSVATTTDMGATWTEHATSRTALPDPVCQGSLIKAMVNVNGVMKEVLFFSNANSSAHRNDITIKASFDLGETWQPAHQLLLDERNCFGYSSLTKIDDNTIGILYEGIRNLYFVRVPVKDIINGK